MSGTLAFSRRRLEAAIAHHRGGRTAAAESLCRAVVAREPENAEAVHLLGALRLARGDAAGALPLIEAAIRLRPGAGLYLHNLGKSLELLGRLDEAVAAHRRAAAARPEDADVWEALAIAEWDNKEVESAVGSFRRALSLAPGRVATRTRFGDLLQEMEDEVGAMTCYRDALAQDDRYAPAHNNLGNILQKQGRYTEAAAEHARAISLNSTQLKYHLNLGVDRFSLGEADAALQAFEACLRLDPFDRRALAYRGAAIVELDRPDAAAVLADQRRWLTKFALPTPAGWDSVHALNRRLAEDLMTHRSLRWEPVGTATTGGADVLLLLQHPTPAIMAFTRELRAVIGRHLADLPVTPGHPFLDRRIDRYELDIWGTVLKAQGYQSPHVHPTGWMSGVYYVQLPPSLGDGGHYRNHAGWIEFGRPGEHFRLTREPPVELMRPVAGTGLFFPSYLYHRTIPFEDPTPRISIAFDVRLTAPTPRA